MAGEFIIEKLGGSGKIVELEGLPGTSAARDRGAGFNASLKGTSLTAIEGTGRDIMIVGFDATDDAVKAVKEGKMAATVAQQPGLIGSMGVEAVKKALNGETMDSYIPVSLKLITE